MGRPSNFASIYMTMTYYSHRMSAAMSSKPGCVEQVENDIEDLHDVCLQGADALTGAWTVYFGLYVGATAGLISSAACIYGSRDSLSQDDSFCEAAVDELRDECNDKYYGS
ncbi:hypothetical protein [Alteromonas gilva]|uniref:Uncharacterized protein n=1 Tax=Alteromonas gilva TaxID=2987522 RepID=A0ABT5L489_9ALTE|nr:hypothetical protein [Alteromonas gilva]MDC8830677.1 hypothetical protein [Alteromonas gilva]